MAIDGGIVVAGAELDDSAGSSGSGSGGSAYVFRTSDGGATYGNVTKLTPADAGANTYFGRAVAIDGGTIAVAAMPYEAGTYVTRYCFAYVFDPNTPTPPPASRPRKVSFVWILGVVGAACILACAAGLSLRARRRRKLSRPPSLPPIRDDLAVDGVVQAPESTKAPDEGREGYDGTDRMYYRLADWYNGAPESMVLRAALGALPMTPRALEAWPGFVVVTKAFLDAATAPGPQTDTAAAVLSHKPWRPRSEAQKPNDAVQAERIRCLAANTASVVSDAPTNRDFDEVEFRHFLDQPDTIEEEESPYTATADPLPATADHVAVAVAYTRFRRPR